MKDDLPRLTFEPATPVGPSVFQYVDTHEVVQEPLEFAGLELETPYGVSKKVLRHVTLSNTSPILYKNTETWISQPISCGPRRTAVATARRLTFSSCDFPSDFVQQDEDDGDGFDSNWRDGDVCVELRQENVDLRRQYQKLVEDLRDKIAQVDYAEDKIIRLERCIDSLKKQHRSVTLPMEKKLDEYRRTVAQQGDAVELTKNLLQDKSSHLSRIEKEILVLKEDRDAAQSELEKACDEVQWYQNYNTALKSELKKSHEIARRQRNEDLTKLEQLTQENAQVGSALQELQAAYRRLEYERHELEEAVVKSRTKSDTHLDQEAIVYDSDEIIMDADVLLTTAFPTQPGKSLFSEIQSSLGYTPEPQPERCRTITEAWTQTEDPIPIYVSTENQNPQTILKSLLTPDSSIENQPGPTSEDVTTEFKMLQPIDHRRNTASMGVIPDENHEHMIQYAFDVPQRSCDKEAAILSRRDWRTLRCDLDQVDLENFKKNFGQEDDAEDGGLFRATRRADDLDEMAETYSEQFPFLAESLFEYLQGISAATSTLQDLPILKARFEELACTFRTDHDQLDRREQIVKNEHINVSGRLDDISECLKQSMLAMRSQKMPGEMRESFNNIEDLTETIQRLTGSLEESAKRIGRIDVLGRVFRLIEVMVLYVRILKTVCSQTVEERNLAKKLLLDAGIPFEPQRSKRFATEEIKENNNLVTTKHLQPIDPPSPGIRKSFSSRKPFFQNFLRLRRTADQPKVPGESGSMKQGHTHLTVLRFRDWIFREFTWPWDSTKTWSGIRKGFALILMLLAVLLILKITSVPSCGTSLGMRSLFGMTHKYPPRI